MARAFIYRSPGPAGRSHWIVGIGGGFAALVLHLLVLGSLTFGVSRTKVRLPDKQGAGASAVVSSAEPVSALILIQIQQVTPANEEPPPDLSSRGFEPEPQLVRITSADASPAFVLDDAVDDPEADTAEAVGNTAARSLIFGRYLGQISARIERAWERPRSPIGEPAEAQFRCQVRITQGPRGEVRNVELRRCNGDEHWRLSLVQAIQTASPLPAPPDPSVFVSSLEMSFDAEPFQAGQNEHGYESERPAIAMQPSVLERPSASASPSKF